MRVLHQRRRGFTLIELLVVLTILVVLISLTAAAIIRFRSTGPQSATQTNLGKIRLTLGNQWKAVADQARNDSMTLPKNAGFLAQAKARASTTSESDPRVKDWFVRLKLIQAFPTNFTEVFAPDGSAALAYPAYVKYLGGFGVTAGNSASWPSADIQCAICLLMIVETGPSNTGVSSDDLGVSAVKLFRLAALSQDVRGIADGWGRPVLFTRTHNAQDATPALLSAGADGRFGVNVVTFATTNLADATDNVLVVNP